MLIHPWDAVEDWRPLLEGQDFGQLVTAGHVDGWPVVDPVHFIVDGDQILLHLARPNPVWEALDADPRVVLCLVGDYVYVDAATNANPGTDPDVGVPTSYYTAVQLHARPGCRPSPAVESDRRLLPGIRGIRISIEHVRAKQKYGGNKTPADREQIADVLADRVGPDGRGRGREDPTSMLTPGLS